MTPTFDLKELTEGEEIVLSALYDSADGNGHDFGFTDYLTRIEGVTPKQWSGYISSLSKKGYFVIHEPHDAGNGTFTQFTWTEKGEAYVDSRRDSLCMSSLSDVRSDQDPVAAKRAVGLHKEADEIEAAQERVAVKRTERRILGFLMNWHDDLELKDKETWLTQTPSASISYGALATEDDETTFGDLIARLHKARKAVRKREEALHIFPYSMLGVTVTDCPECGRERPNFRRVSAGFGGATIPVSACCGGDLR